MSDFSGKLLDGYLLSQTDGYNFWTPWLDIRGAHSCSFIATITGGSGTTIFDLQISNDRESANGPYPATAGSSMGNAKDTCVTQLGTTAMAFTYNSATPGIINQYNIGCHWVRLYSRSASYNQTGKLNIWFSWKK